jgi:hypothetical protein
MKPLASLPAILMLCAATWAAGCVAARAEQKPAAAPRPALEQVVADYVGLYARPTLDRWKTLFHESLVVAYPTEKGGIRARGLDEFFKAQKDYFDTGRKVSERLENVRIDEGRRIARVSADFVFVDEGQESRGSLGLHLIETTGGWKITSVIFSYDNE